ncbi:carbamoyl-phosphate synthase small subunit [Pseudohyphozyma bogoriensis]|nr:carbamoyl-phosphate synthase small subunit [Pseudohyphozyma bogoriensis]
MLSLRLASSLRTGSRGLATVAAPLTNAWTTKPSASHVPTAHDPKKPATLHLKTGQSFQGYAFGAPVSRFGESVFSTSITSYTESMTDPSYRSQFIVFTTPLVGNYGVPENAWSLEPNGPTALESRGIQCAGIVVSDVAAKYSHYQAVESLHEWCDRHGVPGITGVDTRAITSLLRNNGSTLSKLSVGDGHEVRPQDSDYIDPALENLVDQVSTTEVYTLNKGGDVKIALLDFGAKANIVRALIEGGAEVTVFPWNFDFNAVRDQFDGLFLSNGPGDPKQCMEAALNVRKTINEWDKPVFGICMGHQIIGLAAGLDAYRMRFGNRGHNQPVLALADSGSIKAGRVYVTSQNHQYALELVDPFPKGWEPFFLNANDASVEGIKSTTASGKRVWGVQFHPEAKGGPWDTLDMFTSFLNDCRNKVDPLHELGERELVYAFLETIKGVKRLGIERVGLEERDVRGSNFFVVSALRDVVELEVGTLRGLQPPLVGMKPIKLVLGDTLSASAALVLALAGGTQTNALRELVFRDHDGVSKDLCWPALAPLKELKQLECSTMHFPLVVPPDFRARLGRRGRRNEGLTRVRTVVLHVAEHPKEWCGWWKRAMGKGGVLGGVEEIEFVGEALEEGVWTKIVRAVHENPELEDIPPSIRVNVEVNCSQGVVAKPASPPFLDLSEVHTQFRASGTDKLPDTRNEVLFATLAALGARRTTHSAVAGPQALVAAKSAEEVARLGLGAEREGACRTLVQRAVDLAISPRHPFTFDLATHYIQTHTTRTQISSDLEFDAASMINYDVIEYDALTAILLRRPLQISATELTSVYGWRPEMVPNAVAFARLLGGGKPSKKLSVPGRVISVHTLRGIAGLQRQAPTKDFKKLHRTFAKLWDVFSPLQHSLQSLLINNYSQTPPTLSGRGGRKSSGKQKISVGQHFVVLLMFYEASLLAEAERLCAAQEEMDEGAKELVGACRRRFVKWLKMMIPSMCHPQFDGTPEAIHSRALLLTVLDLAPNWPELATRAAVQNFSGAGEFADLGITWEDLDALRKCLQYSSAVFYRSAKQEKSLAAAFEAMEVSREVQREEDMQLQLQAAEASGSPSFIVDMMVDEALRNLGREE